MFAWVTSTSACLFHPRALPAPLHVHVWRARLRKLPFTDTLLSSAERERAEKLDNVTRHRFIQTRTLVRRVLSAYLPNVSKNELIIDTNKHGKPYLPHYEQLRFNIAHTNDRVAIAVCRDVSVGIDIELVSRPIRNIERLAKRLLSTAELSALYNELELGGNQDLQRRELLKLWTCKEAFVKCIGTGIAAGGLSSFDVSIAQEDSPRLVALNGDTEQAREYSFRSLHTNELYTTVAIAAPIFRNVITVDIGRYA